MVILLWKKISCFSSQDGGHLLMVLLWKRKSDVFFTRLPSSVGGPALEENQLLFLTRRPSSVGGPALEKKISCFTLTRWRPSVGGPALEKKISHVLVASLSLKCVFLCSPARSNVTNSRFSSWIFL